MLALCKCSNSARACTVRVSALLLRKLMPKPASCRLYVATSPGATVVAALALVRAFVSFQLLAPKPKPASRDIPGAANAPAVESQCSIAVAAVGVLTAAVLMCLGRQTANALQSSCMQQTGQTSGGRQLYRLQAKPGTLAA